MVLHAVIILLLFAVGSLTEGDDITELQLSHIKFTPKKEPLMDQSPIYLSNSSTVTRVFFSHFSNI